MAGLVGKLEHKVNDVDRASSLQLNRLPYASSFFCVSGKLYDPMSAKLGMKTWTSLSAIDLGYCIALRASNCN